MADRATAKPQHCQTFTWSGGGVRRQWAINEEQGTTPMSTLQDGEMEQLSRLLARGSLSNAREISRLLKAELSEQADVRTAKDLRSPFNFLRSSLLGR